MELKDNMGFSDWLDKHASNAEDTAALESVWEMTGSYRQGEEPDVSASFSRLQARLANAENGGAAVVPFRRRARVFQIAASIAVLIVAGYVLLNMAGNNEVAHLTATTNLSETIGLSLEDGSRVTLNQASKLEYPPAFSNGSRKVALEGEAFFEVEKDAQRPFSIHTGYSEIEVLGTSFNVRDYADEPTLEVFVKTGKVAVTIKSANERYTLAPGQALVFDKKSGKVQQNVEATENRLAWKNQTLHFEESPLGEILGHFERVYGVEINLKNPELAECPFTVIIRQKKLKDAFKALETSCDLNFKTVSPGAFIVSGQCCN